MSGEGYGYGYGYGNQNQSSYGNYAGEGNGSNYQRSESYGGAGYTPAPPQGSAQSYYGSSEQHYHQAPPQSQYGQGQYGQSQYGQGQSGQQYSQQYEYSHDQDRTSQQRYGETSQYGQDYTPPPQHFMQPPGAAGDGDEGDRGIMGALAGGAAGAYGGHKFHHGIIGGLGGAVAGSLAEDAWKKHRSHSNSGDLHSTAHDLRIEDRSTLVADCKDQHGHKHQSALELNDCFTNQWGHLKWERGGNFAASARGIRLSHKGTILEAELGDGNGGWRHNEIDLSERIKNDNGRLIFMG